MGLLQAFFQGLIDLGASVFLPIIVTLIGIILGMKPLKAFSAGLTLGVALVGMNHVMALMTDSVGAAAQAFVIIPEIHNPLALSSWPLPLVLRHQSWSYLLYLLSQPL